MVGDAAPSRGGLRPDGVIVVCRGERALQHGVAWKDEVEVYEEIRDSRMNDPVAVWYSDRADVRTVADFAGQKLLSYRFGRVKIEDWKEGGCGLQGAEYGPGEDGMGDHEFAGELAIAGFPFQVGVANVDGGRPQLRPARSAGLRQHGTMAHLPAPPVMRRLMCRHDSGAYTFWMQ